MGYTISWEQFNFTDFTYNNVITIIPKVIATKFRLESWGFIVGPNSNDCICIERIPTQMTYCKTNRLPYTKDVMKVLIIMVEYGVAIKLDHDDDSMAMFLEALNEIYAIHLIVSYEKQKDYFTKGSN